LDFILKFFLVKRDYLGVPRSGYGWKEEIGGEGFNRVFGAGIGLLRQLWDLISLTKN